MSKDDVRRRDGMIEDGLADLTSYSEDAWHNAEVTVFRNALRLMNRAMDIEGVEHHQAQCVLERVLFGFPSDSGVLQRAQAHQRELDLERGRVGSSVPIRIRDYG